MKTQPLVVWRFRDGKTGHERQTTGLLNALSPKLALEVFDIDVRSLRIPLRTWLRCAALCPDLPAPDLLLGAGRACQLPLLAARRAHGGRAVYCMKPGLPARCFDWCLIPDHDGVAASARIELTSGVINDILPARPSPADRWLILIGGPSRHVVWDDEAVCQQVASLVFGRPAHTTLLISDSRRTPPSLIAKLRSFTRPGVEVVSHRTTSATWLAETFDTVSGVWVTADSVSMLFEVLTAGRALGVLAVVGRDDDRIAGIAPTLIKRGLATSIDGWLNGAKLKAPTIPLAEAARCAELLVARWFAQ